MTRIDLLMSSNAIREYRHMGWLARRRYSRRIDHALRYVCAPDVSWRAVLETAFWLLAAAFVAGCVIGFPVAVVRWCLCL